MPPTCWEFLTIYKWCVGFSTSAGWFKLLWLLWLYDFPIFFCRAWGFPSHDYHVKPTCYRGRWIGPPNIALTEYTPHWSTFKRDAHLSWWRVNPPSSRSKWAFFWVGSPFESSIPLSRLLSRPKIEKQTLDEIYEIRKKYPSSTFPTKQIQHRPQDAFAKLDEYEGMIPTVSTMPEARFSPPRWCYSWGLVGELETTDGEG